MPGPGSSRWVKPRSLYVQLCFLGTPAAQQAELPLLLWVLLLRAPTLPAKVRGVAV